MSSPIEEKIVKMSLDNSGFLIKVSQTLLALTGLENKLAAPKNAKFGNSIESVRSLQSAVSSFHTDEMANGIERIAGRFSTLGVIATTVLANITNKVVNTGANMIRGLTIEPIMGGYSMYENKLKSIQVILANTQGKSNLGDVTKSLGELNDYASKTIYSFQDMTTNMGTFTAAGVDLNTAKTAIEGIGNLAAASGSSTQQASMAMYQLSQAIASGKVGLQDWNSVVNAGMGGKKFQTALEESAASMGHARDMTKSFRDSLQDGWLTTEVLMQTLTKFSTDKAMLKAATQAKTFSDVMSTTKETIQTEWGSLWEMIFGNFEQAPKLWTGVAESITGVVADIFIPAIKTMDTLMNTLGGRKIVLEGLGNAFKALGQVTGTIKDGFREIFPAASAKQLLEMVTNFREFSKSMLLSKDALENLKNTFAGVFAAIDIVRKVVVILAKAFLSLIPGNLGTGIFGITGELGSMIVNLDKSIGSGKGFINIFKHIGNILGSVIDVLSNFGKGIGIAAKAFGEFASGLISQVQPALKTIFDGLGKVAGHLTLGTLFGAGGIVALLKGAKSFKKVGDSVSGFFDAFKNLLHGAKAGSEALELIKGALNDLTATVNVIQLAGIAASVMALAIAIKLLSGIKASDISKGLMALAVAMAFLVKAMKILGGMNLNSLKVIGVSVALILLSAALLEIAAALKIMSSIPFKSMEVALLGLAGSLAILVGALKVMTKKINPFKVIGVSVALVILAGALLEIAAALKIMSSIPFEGMEVALLGLAASLTILVGALKVMSKNSRGSIRAAIALGILAGALLVLSVSLKMLSSIKIDDMGVALLGLAGALVIMVGSMTVFNKLSGPMLKNASALLIMSVALLAISAALTVLSSIPLANLGVGLLGLAGVMTILVAAIALMGKTSGGALTGAAAMAIMAGSIVILSVSLTMLSGIPLKSLGVALLGISVGIAAMVIPLLLLNAAGPGVIISAAAMVLMASAITILSTALAALSAVPFAALMGSVLAISTVLVVITAASIAVGATGVGGLALLGFAAVLGSIGLAAAGVGMALAAFAAVLTLLSTLTVGQVNNITKSFTELLQGLITNIPLMIQAATEFIMGMVNALVANIPALANAGLQMILGLLTAINNNIYQITSVAIQIIVNFANAISDNMPTLVQAGFNLMVQFINSMADTIRSNGPELINAVLNIVESILEVVVEALVAVVNVLFGWIPGVKGATKNIGSNATEALRGAFKAGEVGKEKGGEFGGGVGSKNGDARSKGKGLGNAAKGGAESIKLNSAGSFAGQGFLTGLASTAKAIWDKASSIADGVLKHMKRALNEHSPSKETQQIGIFAGMGLANGIDAQTSNVAGSATNLANAITNALASSDATPTITPIMDLSNINASDVTKNLPVDVTGAYSATNTNEQLIKIDSSTLEKKLDALLGDDRMDVIGDKIATAVNDGETYFVMDSTTMAKLVKGPLDNLVGNSIELERRGVTSL